MESKQTEPVVQVARLYRGVTWSGEQVLVTIWDDDTAEVATREHDQDTWSPPMALEDHT